MITNLPNDWKDFLIEELNQPYFKSLTQFVANSYLEAICYPPADQIFNSIMSCSLSRIKVVVLGQDPYHGTGQANGLCFSVNDGIALPPSLVNIFKEIKDDLNIDIPSSGNLKRWANQGVLLLNSTLTVFENQAGSHQNRGWEQFTDAIIKLVSDRNENVVFLLWGSFAQKKEILIDSTKHLILKSSHPSPLSVYRGFRGCKHFSKTNDYLISKSKLPVVW